MLTELGKIWDFVGGRVGYWFWKAYCMLVLYLTEEVGQDLVREGGRHRAELQREIIYRLVGLIW